MTTSFANESTSSVNIRANDSISSIDSMKIFRHRSNRVPPMQRSGDHVFGGAYKESRRKCLMKTTQKRKASESNRGQNEELDQKRSKRLKRTKQQMTSPVANNSTSSASISLTKDSVISVSDAFESKIIYAADTTSKIFLPSNGKRRFQEVATSTSNDDSIQNTERDESEEPSLKRSRKMTTSITNGSNYIKDISHTKQAVPCRNHLKRKAQQFKSRRYDVSQENSTSLHEVEHELSCDIPSYDSEEDCQPQKRIPKSRKTWIESQRFANECEAKAFVKKQSIWSTYTTNKLSNGKKVIYRCNNSKLRGKQCDASVCLFYLSTKEEVVLYKTAAEHSCQPIRNRKMSEQTKAKIEQLFIDGFKTRKAIQCKLAAANIKLPTQNQLNNVISQLNIKHFGRSTISLGELEAFLLSKSSLPGDPNEAFVVDYLCDDTNDGNFKFFVSTKTLLRNAVGVDIISADTTYKMVWQGFPISPIGTTDMDRHFHLFGTMVSKEEKSGDFEFAFNAVKKAVLDIFDHEMSPKIVIADAAEAIHNGARAVFGKEIVILMCWFHTCKAIRKNISRFVKDVKVQTEIISDVRLLNLTRDKNMFDKASALFLSKYSKFKEFCLYFKTEWLENHPNWYEGAYLLAPGVKYAPSTNNSLERWNRNIKDEKSERNRYPLSVFKNKILQWTVEWSLEYKSEAKTFAKLPTIGLPLWTGAYKWVKLDKPVRRVVNKSGSSSYKFAAGDAKTINWSLSTKWNTFQEFKDRFCLGWQTTIQNEDNWMDGSCSCPSYMKTYICKHLVGLAIRLKFVKPPLEAKALPLTEKRKRGRPSKAKKALLIQ